MKKQIRRGVFETNSSSVHSLTMCSQDEYSKWEKGQLLFNKYDNEFKTRDEIIEKLKVETLWASDEPMYSDVDWNSEDEVSEILSDNGYVTEAEFFDDYSMDSFYQSYTTPNGESVIAFGYYGYDG